MAQRGLWNQDGQVIWEDRTWVHDAFRVEGAFDTAHDVERGTVLTFHERRPSGANAVLAMRFDCNEIADMMSEVAAYGTAVTVRKV